MAPLRRRLTNRIRAINERVTRLLQHSVGFACCGDASVEIRNFIGDVIHDIPGRVLDRGLGIGRAACEKHDEPDELPVSPCIAPVVQPAGDGPPASAPLTPRQLDTILILSGTVFRWLMT